MAPRSNHGRLNGAASLPDTMCIALHIDVGGRFAVGELLGGLVGLCSSSAAHAVRGLPVVAALFLQLEEAVTLQNVVAFAAGFVLEVVA